MTSFFFKTKKSSAVFFLLRKKIGATHPITPFFQAAVSGLGKGESFEICLDLKSSLVEDGTHQLDVGLTSWMLDPHGAGKFAKFGGNMGFCWLCKKKGGGSPKA